MTLLSKDGSLLRVVKSKVEELKAEVAYFGDGLRTGYIIFDLKDTSEIPGIAEPFFLAFGATVNFIPVMSAADLAAAVPAIERAVAAHGG